MKESLVAPRVKFDWLSRITLTGSGYIETCVNYHNLPSRELPYLLASVDCEQCGITTRSVKDTRQYNLKIVTLDITYTHDMFLIILH